MIDAWPPVPYRPPPVERLISTVDGLIHDVSKTDPLCVALLGLVKTELAARKEREGQACASPQWPSLGR